MACHGARNRRRALVVFDWEAEDYNGFLADPGIPAIARELGLQAPPVHAVAMAEYDS